MTFLVEFGVWCLRKGVQQSVVLPGKMDHHDEKRDVDCCITLIWFGLLVGGDRANLTVRCTTR